LLGAIDSGRLKYIPALARRVIEHQAWKKWRWIGNDFSAATLDDYVTAHPPKGLGASISLIQRLLAVDPRVLDQFERERRAEDPQHIALNDAKDQRPAHLHVTRDVDNANAVVNIKLRPTGNSKVYALRRLDKDRPDIYARVITGEITAHAGMIEAGFRKRPPSQKKSPLGRALALIEQMTAADQQVIWRKLHQRCGGR
jgi:hypothetical protein